MGRRPSPIGTWGNIKTKRVGKRWQAEARIRVADGSQVRVQRRGDDKTAAEDTLKLALLGMQNEIRGGEITKDTRVRHAAAIWVAELERDERLGTISHGTVRLYKSKLKNWILPKMGELCWREVTVAGCERVLNHAQDNSGFQNSSQVRTALGLLCGLAVRHEALDTNPVRSAKRLRRGEEAPKTVRALEPAERVDLLAKLAEFVKTKTVDILGRPAGPRAQPWQDLVDLAEAFMSTGGRISEVLAVLPEDVDPAEKTVALDHHVVRVTGKGLFRKPKRKGGKDGLLLGLPEWSIPMWRRRKLASGGAPLFATADGKLLDPSNTMNRLRQAFDWCGYPWLTSHGLGRKTVAAQLDDSGLPVTAIADQLGNSPDVAEKHYRRRRKANPKQAAALEGMFDGEAI